MRRKDRHIDELFFLAFLLTFMGLFSAFYQYDDTVFSQFRIAQGTQSVTQSPQEPATTSERIIYVYGTGLVARKDSSGVTYEHQDYLSSNRFASDGSGRLVSRNVQEPYGSTLEDVGTSAALRNDYTFTGKERDERLYYFGARYYDPQTARFVSVDPVPTNVSSYSYAANNPLKYIDPTGKDTQHYVFGLLMQNEDAETIIYGVYYGIPPGQPPSDEYLIATMAAGPAGFITFTAEGASPIDIIQIGTSTEVSVLDDEWGRPHAEEIKKQLEENTGIYRWYDIQGRLIEERKGAVVAPEKQQSGVFVLEIENILSGKFVVIEKDIVGYPVKLEPPPSRHK